jgi:hypothetical protein
VSNGKTTNAQHLVSSGGQTSPIHFSRLARHNDRPTLLEQGEVRHYMEVNEMRKLIPVVGPLLAALLSAIPVVGPLLAGILA